MTTAIGANTYLSIVPETAYGVTPATPTMTKIPFISSSLNLVRASFEDTAINGDRMEHYLRLGNRSASGSINTNFSYAVFDALLASLMCKAPTSGVFTTGTQVLSLSLEEGHPDLATPEYIDYTGVVVNQLQLTVPTTALVSCQWDLLGANAVVSATHLAAPTAAAANEPMVHLEGTFNEGGSVIGVLTAIALTITNGYAPTYVLGSNDVHNQSFTQQKITGTATAYFESTAMLNKFINETPSSIDFTLADQAGNSVEFNMPNVKYTGATKSITNDGPISIDLPFSALYDATSTATLTITATAHS